MEKILIEFVNTLDSLLKKLDEQVGDSSGIARLTIHQFRYIDAVYELGEPTITEIADKMGITKASVTAGINKLINLGYVHKTRSTDDRRVFHVSLTDAGGRLIEAKYQALKEYGEFVRSALNDEEARQFEEILAKLVHVFKQSK